MHLNLLGLKRPNINHPEGDSNLALVLLLGFFEFSIAAIATLVISKDPKNSFLFGFSLSRLILFLVSLVAGIGNLILAVKAYQGKKCGILTIIRKIAAWTDISFLLFLIGCLIALLDVSMLGELKYGFERLRPILLVGCFLPIQYTFTQLSRVKLMFDKSLWLPVFFCFLATLLFTSFIVFTKLGITPDKVFWNVAGMPLSSAQLVMILIGIMICLELIMIIKKYLPDHKFKYLDIGLCVVLFVSAVLVWNLTPFNGHFFADIAWPLNQPFPVSDARGRDLGALSITIGQGISFNEHTVSPLHEVFLAILHGIAGYDYNLITQLQLLILALIPVVLYLLGKTFNNRLLGLLIGAIVIVRQSNAILLARTIAGSNPYLLTTEMPTYLALTVFTGLVFWWLKKGHKSAWIPFFSGAVLGMASLIRVNPIILFPTIPVIALATMWKTKKKWLAQVTAYFIGFLLLIVPWLFTGTTEEGQSFFLQKFYNVIEQRYDPSGLIPPVEDNTLTTSLFSKRARMKIADGSNGETITIIDIYEFPGFMVNHFLHNVVASVLALPDSIAPSDQVLQQLALRPYWVEQEPWFGELKISQKFFLLINLSLLSLGLGWSWKQWRWTGLMPFLIFLVYLVSMGFARVSGSRYIVPVDWVIFFYYSIGLGMLLKLTATLFKLKIQPEFETTSEYSGTFLGGKKRKWILVLAVISLVGIAASIPIADNMIPSDKLLCENESIINSLIPLYTGNPQNVKFLAGRVLYPTIKDKTLTFTLLTCRDSNELDQDSNELELESYTNQISSGQLVVMILEYPLGLGNSEMMISLENDTPEILWER